MNNRRTTILLGGNMVTLDCVQAADAAMRSDAVLAGRGLVYAALGTVLAWRKRTQN